MFKRLTQITLLALCAALAVSFSAEAAFVKNTSAEKTFIDVPETAWYYESVKEANAYGIMNGDSAATFNPEGTLTVAEGITIAARVYASLQDDEIPPSDGEWFTPYVKYAVAGGFLQENTFEDYDRSIKRYEIAELLADVCGELPEINALDGVYAASLTASLLTSQITTLNPFL